MSDVQDPARIQADDSLPSCSARLTRSYQLLAFTSADLRLLPPTALFFSAVQGPFVLLHSALVESHRLQFDVHDAPWFDVAPVAAGEVRDGLGARTVADGGLRELAQAARRRQVIDVHVERESVLQAVRPAEVHDEVHAAVSADLLRHFGDVTPHRMHVLLADALRALLVEPLVRLAVEALVLECALERKVADDAARAGDKVDPGVRTRRAHVMLDHDRLASDRLDQGRVHLAHRGWRILLARIVVAEKLLLELLVVRVAGSALERDKVVESVAAVDAHRLADRHEPVRRIPVAHVVHVFLIAPRRLGVELARGRDDFAEVVNVRSFGVVDLSEHAHPGQIELQKLDLPVDAVLELHAGKAPLLGRLHELPALANRQRRSHLDKRNLAAVEGPERHRLVKRPRRRAVDDVAVAEVAEVLVGRLADIAFGHDGMLLVREPFHVLGDAGRILVAERDDVDSGNHRHAVDGAGAASADADEADADALHRTERIVLHRDADAEAEARTRAAGRHRSRPHPQRALEKITTVALHFLSPDVELSKQRRRIDSGLHQLSDFAHDEGLGFPIGDAEPA